MKNKFYASLFIGIGLIVTATPSFAKIAQPTVKKQTPNSAKPVKTNVHNVSSKKQEQQAPKKALSNTVSKQKPSESKTHQLVDTKDIKHDKAKAQQLADAKDAKHGKTKAQQLATAKDAKHGKTKAQQLAAAKDAKHGKTKAQQLAAAKNTRRSKARSHQVINESYEEDNEEGEQLQATDDNDSVDSLAVDQTNSNETPLDNTYSKGNAEESSPLIAAPTKSSNLFFQPTRPLASSRPNPINIPPHQVIDSYYHESNKEQKSNPLIAAPTTKVNNEAIRPMTNNDRIHSLIASGTQSDDNPSHQSIDSSDEDEEETEFSPSVPRENNNLIIQPIQNNKRIHSSVAPRNTNNFINNAINNETTHHVASAHGVIDSSLTTSGEKAGLSNDMVIQLTDVFAWDIDFANNLQEGDQFTVIYEEAGMGNKANSNQIIAAQFINRGKTYTAIRYKDKEGMVNYYTPDGRSLRKAFLTTPIDFARVSSPFDPHRRHPILNRIRAHKGVDYAARTGTPVKAAGDGVIVSHSNKGAYGRMIVISHGEHYETAYAHLSNFRKDLQDGEPVKQGDVIGYVGQSGLATGPHLHYEFRVDGEHRDPEKLDSKQAMRLPNGVWEDFHAQTIPVLTQLNQAKVNTLVAKNP